MRHRISIYALLLFASHAVTLASNLVWDRTEAHIEMEPDQVEARAVFTVTNQGEKAVRIARIKTSCGCTGSVIDRKIIEPGKSTEIIATFNKGKRQGLNRNRLQVFLDNQPDAVATLVMSVQIPALIDAIPKFVYWSKDNSRSARRIRISMDERYINRIVEIEYDRDRLRVTEEPGEPNTEVDRVLVVEPLDYDTLFRGSIQIRGTGPNGRKHETRLHAFVQP